MLGRDFEDEVWSRSVFELASNPIGYFGKMNSTLGSVVPLAMFQQNKEGKIYCFVLLLIDIDFSTFIKTLEKTDLFIFIEGWNVIKNKCKCWKNQTMTSEICDIDTMAFDTVTISTPPWGFGLMRLPIKGLSLQGIW